MAKPDKIRIPLNDDHFENVGQFPDGKQFMAYVTGTFPAGMKYYAEADWQSKKKWLAVIHLFDSDGNHIETQARLGGFDIEGQQVAANKAYNFLSDMFTELKAGVKPKFCDIWVRLFSVTIDNVTYGLLYEQSQEEEDDGEQGEWVMLEPRDIMFHPPWDSGEYST